MQILYFFPGQEATLFLETKDDTGARADGSLTPVLNYTVLPDGTTTSDYNVSFTKINVGLYTAKIRLPKGTTSIGSYLFNVTYDLPVTSTIVDDAFQIIINAPYGIYSVTSS